MKMKMGNDVRAKTFINSSFYENNKDSLIAFGAELKIQNGKKQIPNKKWDDITTNIYNAEKNIFLNLKCGNIIVIDIDRDKTDGCIKYGDYKDIFEKLLQEDTLITKTQSKGFHLYFKLQEDELIDKSTKIKGLNIDILGNASNQMVIEGDKYNLYNDADIIPLPMYIRQFIGHEKFYSNRDKEIEEENKINTNKKLTPHLVEKYLLNNLTENYYTNFGDWIKVLIILKYEFKEGGKKIALDFSKQWSGFKKENFNNHWNSIYSNGKSTIGSLFYFVKESIDNDEKYDEIKKIFNIEEKENNDDNSILITDKFCEVYKNDIIVLEGKYTFIKNDYNIFEYENSFVNYYTKQKLRKLIKDFNLNFKLTINNSTTILNYCADNINFKKNIEDFDNKGYLLAFKDGVYDLNTSTFRLPIIEDGELITSYIDKEFNKIISNVKNFDNINKFMDDIFNDKEITNFLLDKLSTHLNFENNETFQEALFFTGDGSNGKSLLLYVFLLALSKNKVCPLSSSILYNDIQAGGTNSSLTKMENKLFGIIKEIKEGAKIKNSIFKELTGEQTFTARGLYKGERDYLNTFTMICCDNGSILFQKYEEALDRRIITIPFENIFTTKKTFNKNNKNHKLIKKFSNKEKNQLSDELLVLLLQRYEGLKDIQFNIPFPQKVVDKFEELKEDNGHIDYKDIFKEYFEYSNDKNDYLKIKDIKDLLKDYNFTFKSTIHKNKLVNIINCNFMKDTERDGKRLKNIFTNIKIKSKYNNIF